MSTPHDLSPIFSAGAPLNEAAGALVLLHGRGASAADILGLSRAFQHLNLAFVAPEAAGNAWYPLSFLAPRQENEPYLSSALTKVDRVVQGLIGSGMPAERIAIAGFSQGACLATEFVASHPQRYAGLLAFTGGLIGAPGSSLHHEGDLCGTPALFLSGDPDPHVPWARVQESAEELQRMGAAVSSHRYRGKPHSVSPDEIDRAVVFLTEAFAHTASK